MDFKDAIKQEVATIDCDHALLERVMKDFQHRIENHIYESGHHLIDNIFHKNKCISNGRI